MAQRSGRLKKSIWAAIIVLAIAVFCIWQNNSITVSESVYENPRVPAEFDGFKIVQISDLHNKMFGKGQKTLLAQVEKLSPDVIFITGDLVDRRKYDLDAAMIFVHGAVEIAPVYYVSGNHEAWSGKYPEIRDRLEEAGVYILDDTAMELRAAVAARFDDATIEQDAAARFDDATIEQDAAAGLDDATIEQDAAAELDDAAIEQDAAAGLDDAAIEQDAAAELDDAAIEQDAAAVEQAGAVASIQLLGLSDPDFFTSDYMEGTDLRNIQNMLDEWADGKWNGMPLRRPCGNQGSEPGSKPGDEAADQSEVGPDGKSEDGTGGGSSGSCFTILLSHRPELFDLYSKAGIDLIFSGHAHGGQFRIPFVGGLVAPDQGFFPKYTSGSYREGSAAMYVSRGLGNSVIPIRIFNRPEIVSVVLKRAGD